MRSIDDINFKGKRALIRVDYNVPLNAEHKITDSTRIDSSILTINKILEDGGSVVLMSHLGRPKEGPEEKFSLKHLIPYLSEKLKRDVKFADDCVGDKAKSMSQALQAGEVLLLENLRFYKEETKGDVAFAEKLASHGDVYVNDAFGTAHRAHASTAVIAKFFPENKVSGYIMFNEIRKIDAVLNEGGRPFTAILGGAKVSGKVEVINSLLHKVDNLIIGGGMMFTFIKAMGGNIGSSLVEEELLELAKNTLEGAKIMGVNFYIPVDAVIADKFENDAQILEAQADDIPEEWMGLDIGNETIKTYVDVIRDSKTILWNGPMGVFEMSSFENGTKQIGEAVGKATFNGAFSLIGGGDTVAAVNKYNLENVVSYVSTGGGAMLEYIEGKVLPGIAALEE
jgi:phosphoglycerate kinase